MSYWLKQSTAVNVQFGPFLDETDGKTAETGLTIAQADIRLSKNGANIAQSNNAAGATHDELGFYVVPLDTTDTATLGSLLVAVHESGALPVFQYFMVVPANVWDSMFGADKLQTDVTQILDHTLTDTGTQLADGFEKFFDVGTPTGTVNSLPGAAPDAAGGLPVSDAGGLDLDVQIGTDIDAILVDTAVIGALGVGLSAVPWNSDWDAEVQSEVDDSLVAHNLDHLCLTVTAAADMTTEVADNTILSRIIGNGDTSTFVPSTDGLHAAGVDLDAILADSGELQTNQGAWATATGFSTHTAANVWAVATRVLTANTNLNDPTAASIADAVWDELSTGHVSSGKAGEQLWTDVDAILDDTSSAGVVVGSLGAGAIVAATFGTDAIDANAVKADMIDLIWDEVMESTLTARQIQRVKLAVLAGLAAGGGSTSITFRDVADGKNRVAATVDSDGNRTAITLDGS